MLDTIFSITCWFHRLMPCQPMVSNPALRTHNHNNQPLQPLVASWLNDYCSWGRCYGEDSMWRRVHPLTKSLIEDLSKLKTNLLSSSWSLSTAIGNHQEILLKITWRLSSLSFNYFWDLCLETCLLEFYSSGSCIRFILFSSL